MLSVLHINLVFEEALVEHPELDSEFSLCSASKESMLFSVQQLELESLELLIPMLLATHLSTTAKVIVNIENKK